MRTSFFSSFLGEMAKVSAASSQLKASKTRSGRRPMSVTTMLRKEKDGSFYKQAGVLIPTPEEAQRQKEILKEDKTLKGARIAAGAGLGVNVGGMLALRPLTKGYKGTDRTRALQDALFKNAPDVKHVVDPSIGANAAHFLSPEGAGVLTSQKHIDPAVIAHELGHGEFGKTRTGHVLQDKLYRKMAPHKTLYSAGAPILAGSLLGASDSPYATVAAGAIPAVLHAPTVASEAMASVKGLGALRRAGASKKELALSALKLAPAFGTYLGSAALSSGLGVASQRGIRAARQAARESTEGKPQKLKGVTKTSAAMQDVDERLQDVNDYLLMGTPKLAAAYWMKMAEGTAEKYLPWYGTALGGAGGALAGAHLVPGKYKTLATLGGTLAGTALGLHGGELLGKGIDKGVDHLRKPEEPKLAAAQQWLTMPYTAGESKMQNVPVTAKRRAGDAPTADGSDNILASRQTPNWSPPETSARPKVAYAERTVEWNPGSGRMWANERSFPKVEVPETPKRWGRTAAGTAVGMGGGALGGGLLGAGLGMGGAALLGADPMAGALLGGTIGTIGGGAVGGVAGMERGGKADKERELTDWRRAVRSAEAANPEYRAAVMKVDKEDQEMLQAVQAALPKAKTLEELDWFGHELEHGPNTYGSRGRQAFKDLDAAYERVGASRWQPAPQKVAEALHPLVVSPSDQVPDRGSDSVPIRLDRARDIATVSGSTESPRQLGAEYPDVTKIAFSYLIQLEMEKVANDPNLSEMEKEALLQQLRQAGGYLKNLGGAIAGSPVKLQVGDDVMHLASNKVLPSYKGIGKSLHETGKLLQLPKGMTPQQVKDMGIRTSAGSRIAGEGLASAGQHMEHAHGINKALNPLGKPVGGVFEGVTRGIGNELERASGAVSTGLEGLGRGTLGGGATGAVGRGLQRFSPHAGTAGEIAGAAGTATALGAAVSPAAGALGSLMKSTGVYAPLKAHLGASGLNLAKDVAATGVEKGLHAGTKILPRAVAAVRGVAAAA